MKIRVEIDGRPPNKRKAKSIWRGPMAERVLNLRLAILDEKKKLGIRGPLKQRVKMTLAVHGPNIDNPKLPQTYVGDIDSLVAGICDSIRKADHNMVRPSRVFDDRPEVGHDKPLLITDDSQVVRVGATKSESGRDRYVLVIEAED